MRNRVFLDRRGQGKQHIRFPGFKCGKHGLQMIGKPQVVVANLGVLGAGLVLAVDDGGSTLPTSVGTATSPISRPSRAIARAGDISRILARDVPAAGSAIGVPARVTTGTGSFRQVRYYGMEWDPDRIASKRSLLGTRQRRWSHGLYDGVKWVSTS